MYTVKIDGDIIKSVENTDSRAFQDVIVFAGDNFYPPADGSYTNLIWGSFNSPPGNIQENFQLATIDEWGPLFRISFDLIIYSMNINSEFSSVLAFKGNGGVDNDSLYGSRAPAIFYNNLLGELAFTSSVSGNPNFDFRYEIELNRLYHIDIVQEVQDGQVSGPQI